MKSIRLVLTLIISVFLFSAIASAQTRQGYDVLGLAMYCKQYLRAPKLPAVSTLLATFGNPLPCIEQRIGQGGLQLVQVDLRDATCFRNRVCPPGTPALTDWRVLRKRAQEVNVLAVKYPSIEWWASPWLEHDIKDAKLVQKACDVIKKGCPSCKCINSPFTGAKPAGIPVELHGTKVRAFSVSGDGASIFDGDNIASDGNGFEHRVSGQDQTYAWWNELNLRCTGEEKFTQPLKRTEKPTADQFRQAYLNMQPEAPKPAAPAVCKGVRDIEMKREITKPNAESYCNGQPKDPRGNKPLLIIKHAGRRGDKLDVFSPAGAKVASFCYWGTFSDLAGAHRWYMGNCSGHTPAKLYDALGGEWGFAKLKNGQCLRFNAVRRQGTYR